MWPTVSPWNAGLHVQVPKQSPRSLNGSATSLSSLDANAGSHSPSSPRSSKAFGKSIIANGDPQMLMWSGEMFAIYVL